MKRYNRISLFLSAFFIVLCLGTMSWAQGHGARASDGNGPDPIFILVLILMWPAGIALAHSTGIGVALLVRGKRHSREAKENMWGNGMLWLLIISLWASPKLTTLYHTYRTFQYDHLATSVALADIDDAPLADFEKHYAQAQADKPYEHFADDIKSKAEVSLRLDIMKNLKAQGVAFASPGDEDGWIASVDRVVSAGSTDSRTKLAVTRWLLDEGTPYGYSLARKSSAFADPQRYWTAYKDLSDPATRQLLDLLMAHGVDINACENGTSCPLWYVARYGKVGVMRYLLAHGAPVNRVDSWYGSTALGQALAGADSDTIVQIVNMLLDAGANVTLGHDSDVVAACDRASRSKDGSARQVIQLLRDAHARVGTDALERFKDTVGTPDSETAGCVKSFL